MALRGLVAMGMALAVLKMIQTWGGFVIEIPHPMWLLLALLFQAGCVVAAAITWQRALYQVTGQFLDDHQAMAHTGILLVAKYLPGKVWGLIGRGVALRGMNLSVREISVATLLEQVAFLASGWTAMAAGWYRSHWSWFMMVLLFLSWLACPVGVRLLPLLSPRLPKRLQALLAMMEEGRGQLCSRGFWRLCWLSLWQWLFYSAVLAAIVGSLAIDLSWPLLMAIVAAVPASLFSGMLFLFLPGGVGVREGVLVFYLQPLIGLDTALTAAVIYRITDTLRDVIMGIWAQKAFNLRKANQTMRRSSQP
ncbi:MAG: flippase-like domain-containing protein [Magnetococcales bacterium]|nr:flippase-like domain-containing protein [Magnetococcales bacterium]